MGASDPKPDPPTLPYAAPPVYFRGQYCCRSTSGLIGVVIALIVGALAFWGPGRIVPASLASALLPRLVATLFRVVGIALFGLSVYGIWLAVTGREWEVLITEDGITRKGRLYPWQDIRCFSAALMRKHVTLQFERREGFPFPRAVELTPLLTVEQYRTLTRKLVEQLEPKYPHLKIEVEPRAGD